MREVYATDSSKSKRVNWVDNAKAIAIILVLLGHTGLEPQSRFVTGISTWIFEFHMPFFFMLSGFSFAIMLGRSHRSFVKQVLNIIILYLVYGFIYIFLNIQMQAFVQTTNVLEKSMLFTFLYSPVSMLWYLYALVIIYIVEYLLNLYVKDDRIRLIITFILTIIGGVTSLGILSKALYHIVFFECGRQMPNMIKKPFWVCLIGLVCSFIVPFFTIENLFVNKLIAVFIAFSLSVLIIKLCEQKLNREYKYFTLIGRSTLWIYLFHSYFTSVVRNLCNRVIGNIPVLSFFIVTAAGIAGPMIFMCICKKLRIDRLITKPIDYIMK